MRVTTKGQVTIPKQVRDRLGIKSGSEVDFVVRNDDVLLVRPDQRRVAERRADSIKEWADRVSGTLDLNGMTADEYMDWIRGPRDDLGPR